MKNTSPSLSLREMWKLYSILPEMGENIFDSLQELSPETLVDAVRILNGGKIKDDRLMADFLGGLKKQDFFSFSEFIRAFNASN